MTHSFGEFLKQRREEKKLTQKKLSKMLFVSESAISKWEKNIAHPDITLLPKLSEILEVSEHELITASIDKQSRNEKLLAKKWRVLSISWSLFFYISYSIALIPCLICDLAINKSLTWFWIVLSAILLAFTFTNLPKIIKHHKLILIPLSMYLSLCLLLVVCCLYTNGKWFWIASLSILLGLVIIFTPIYISKYKVFAKIKKFADFISMGINFVMLNILLLVIYSFTISNGYSNNNWYFKIALPIVLAIYLYTNILLAVRFLKINRYLKTSIILFLVDLIYLIVPLLKVNNVKAQEEINQANIFKADFDNWNVEIPLENNIHCIMFLITTSLSIIFLITGIIRYLKRKNDTKSST